MAYSKAKELYDGRPFIPMMVETRVFAEGYNAPSFRLYIGFVVDPKFNAYSDTTDAERKLLCRYLDFCKQFKTFNYSCWNSDLIWCFAFYINDELSCLKHKIKVPKRMSWIFDNDCLCMKREDFIKQNLSDENERCILNPHKDD